MVGNRFIIVGGSGGIGAELVALLSSRRDRVHCIARNETPLRTIAEEYGSSYSTCDATNSTALAETFKTAAASLGGVDGVVNLVGSIVLKPAHSTSDKEWLETLNLNLNSSFFVLREAVSLLMDSGGSIVLLGSAAGRLGLINHEAIAAAKAGVAGLARSAAATYSRYGIRVNVVSPGLVETPLSSKIVANDAVKRASEKMHPLGRLGAPQDVARAIAWFLDSEQSWITGQELGVDGGLATLRAR